MRVAQPQSPEMPTNAKLIQEQKWDCLQFNFKWQVAIWVCLQEDSVIREIYDSSRIAVGDESQQIVSL